MVSNQPLGSFFSSGRKISRLGHVDMLSIHICTYLLLPILQAGLTVQYSTVLYSTYNVPKTRQISEKIREEVPWKENFPVIRGNDDYFPRITGKFSLQGTSSSLPTKICQIFGTVYNTVQYLKYTGLILPSSLLLYMFKKCQKQS